MIKAYKSRANTLVALDDVNEELTNISISSEFVLINIEKQDAVSRSIFQTSFEEDAHLEQMSEQDFLDVKQRVSEFILGVINHQDLLDATTGFHLISSQTP